MIYTTVKFLFGVALREFFSKITVRGAPLEQGPAIIVGNHQNFALDSFLIALCFKRKLWGLGKATLFEYPLLGWLLRQLGVAPLYRKMDDPSKLSKNTETFEAVARLLHQKNAVLLFPEGVSLGERALQPIKTGAARMALQAEAAAGFDAGVHIQPVGITYSDLTLFRSTVTILLGEPFSAQTFKEAYTLNPREAVERCTAAIEERLRAVSVNIEDQRHARLVERIAWLYRAGGRGNDDFERFSLIAKNVEFIGAKHPRVREELEAELSRFEQQCAALGVEPEDNVTAVASQHRVTTFIRMMCITPFILLAVVVMWIPYRFVGAVVKRALDHPVYIASTKFFLGLILFPLWFTGLGLGLLFVGLPPAAVAAALALCAVSAHIANRHLPELRAWVIYRLLGVFRAGDSPGMRLARRQAALIERLDRIREV